MKTMRALGVLAVSCILISFSLGPAKAALSWEFGFDGTVNNFSGTGSFTLGGAMGPPSVLTAFEYSGVCGLDALGDENLCSFGLGDVSSAEWMLLPNWSFFDLEIETNVLDFDGFDSILQIREFDLGSDCSVLVLGTGTCNGDNFSSRSSLIGEGAFLRPIHEDIPEPATLALFVIALGGLGFMARRREA